MEIAGTRVMRGPAYLVRPEAPTEPVARYEKFTDTIRSNDSNILLSAGLPSVHPKEASERFLVTLLGAGSRPCCGEFRQLARACAKMAEARAAKHLAALQHVAQKCAAVLRQRHAENKALKRRERI